MTLLRIATSALLCTLLAACGGGEKSNPPPAATAPILLSDAAARAKAPLQATVGLPTGLVLEGKFADYAVLRGLTSTQVTHKARGVAQSVPGHYQLYFSDMTVSLDQTGAAAQAFRLYQAAFDRVPDSSGLGFHIAMMEGVGLSLTEVAQGFVDSVEFKDRYGALDNAAFLTRLYQNILHRAPDPNGLAYWLGLLDSGALSRGQVLAGFADSAENVQLVAPAIEHGIAYVPYISAGGGASVNTVWESAVPWNLDAPVNLILRDANGQVVPGAGLSCSVASAAILTITPDCRSARGLRLGEQDVTVKGAGLSASLRLKVIPQRKPFGTSGNSRHFNLMATPGGFALAWGDNRGHTIGQGLPYADFYNLPQQVKDGAAASMLLGVVATAGGENNAMALLGNGEVVAWSTGATLARAEVVKGLPQPVRNAANDGNLARIVQLQVGQDNAVALTDSGRVMTWGYYHGQGVGGSASFPNEVKHPSGSVALTGIVAVAAGGSFGLALADSGKVYAWGWNSAGETGRGTVGDPERLPAPVVAEDGTELSNIVAISAGYRFSLALTADGKVHAWGHNAWGELGQNSTSNFKSRAVLVKDSAGTGTLGNIAMVSAGGHHALALDTAGRVLSWGYEDDGALGEGANRARVGEYRPMFVVGVDGTGVLDQVVTIAASYQNSQALRRDGTVLVWGNGFYGNLGQGTAADDEVAVPRVVKNLGGAGDLVLLPAGYHNLHQRGR